MQHPCQFLIGAVRRIYRKICMILLRPLNNVNLRVEDLHPHFGELICVIVVFIGEVYIVVLEQVEVLCVVLLILH